MSENITVRSVVGRFLEHTRVYYFYNGGEERLYCGSADWMSRNLFHRVEVAFPVEDRKLFRRVYHDGLISYLKDNVQAWELQGDGSWQQVQPKPGEEPFIAQDYLLQKINNVSDLAAHSAQ